MFLSKRKVQVERIEYLTDGMTPEQAKKHRKKIATPCTNTLQMCKKTHV